MANIQWDRTTEWTHENLVNRSGHVRRATDGAKRAPDCMSASSSRRDGIGSPEPYRTIRDGGVNVLNLVEGEEAVVESPTGAFEPYVVHYAETFIVPAAVGEYTIRPYGAAVGTECATIKAFVRTEPRA